MRPLAFSLLAALLAGSAAAQPDPEPVVVELFTAQGCQGCPAANEVVLSLAERPNVIALTWPVDYWDYLGWKDTYARPEFGARQRAYKTAFKLRDVYTPQVVVDGEKHLSAVDREEVEGVVSAEAEERDYPPDMMFMGEDRVAVGSGRTPRGGAEVWLVRYQADAPDVQVRRGENRGQTVKQGNVVREVVKLGPWRGRSRVFRLPEAGQEGLTTVVLVQAVRSGRIVGARRL